MGVGAWRIVAALVPSVSPGTFTVTDLAGFTAATAVPCVPLTWILAAVAVCRTRGSAAQERSYTVAVWSAGASLLWGVGLGVVILLGSWDAAAAVEFGFCGAAIALIVWTLTLTPIFSYRLAHRALRADPQTAPSRNVREGA